VPGDRLGRLAELIVRVGANVRPGQVVFVDCEPGREEATRAIASAAYRAGARFVDVNYFDPWVKRIRLEHAAEDTLDWVPPWYGDRARQLGEVRAAIVALNGTVAPTLYDDLDPALVAKDRMPSLKEYMELVNERTINWCVAPCPTPEWAGLAYPELEPDEALEALWQAVEHVCRLDEDDPAAAWADRVAALGKATGKLNDHGFDALHFEGPGTDLTVGLLPTSRWESGQSVTVDGIVHLPNLPTEETFTAPDPERVNGIVRATMPFFAADVVVRGLEVRFEGGRVAELSAETGAEAMRGELATDDGAGRLGEVALVDGGGRIGPLGRVFYDTLIDENAASHLAFGAGYQASVLPEDLPRLNTSEVHTDFMIGSDELRVTGITAAGGRVPVLHRGAWQL
jgi:aminopeptidase